MKYDVKQCKILEKQELAKGIFSFVVKADEPVGTGQNTAPSDFHL